MLIGNILYFFGSLWIKHVESKPFEKYVRFDGSAVDPAVEINKI